MTRRSITAVLGSLLVGLLVVVNAGSVAADDMSGGALATVHILSGNELGQEQFEPMPDTAKLAIVSPPEQFMPETDPQCNVAAGEPATCYRALSTGGWKAEQLQGDGTWRVIAIWLPPTE